MNKLSKVCDAADWFDSDFQHIIKHELREPARFHRKQWEFAKIFQALQKHGLLQEDKIGLSVGGGNERILYSIANHVKKLIVTDLYSTETMWDCAKTDDPDTFIKMNKPFEVDDSRITAIPMDMRKLYFGDNTFDFCYSSCAIEHIGTFDDFVQHFNEVNRCLKEGGYYIFTTEFHFGEETIESPNNYIFSPEYLEKIIAASSLSLVEQPDFNLTNHTINFPYPSNLKNLFYHGNSKSSSILAGEFPHLILLRGKFPFTSILLIGQKNSRKKEIDKMNCAGLADSKHFLANGINNYIKQIENSTLTLNPFSDIPNEMSRFYQDHAHYFEKNSSRNYEDENTLFHTDYFWFGKGSKNINISFDVVDANGALENLIQFRIHRYATLSPTNVESVLEHQLKLEAGQKVSCDFKLDVNEDYNYAILCKALSGNYMIDRLNITCKAGSSSENEPIEILTTNEELS